MCVTLFGCVFFVGCGEKKQDAVIQTVVKTTEIEVIKPKGFKSSALPTRKLFQLYSPSVVSVFAVIDGEIAEFGDRRRGVGNGFVISSRGEIVTTAHAITRETEKDLREASEVYVRFQSGEELPVEVIGLDPSADVALLRVNSEGLRLRPIRFSEKRRFPIGERVVAIGAPLQDTHTFSSGIISAVDRSITTLTGFPFPAALQTDTPVNLANSGGPALLTNGKAIGLLTEVRSTQGSGDGVGFIIPSRHVLRSVRSLRKTGDMKYVLLGVTAVDVFPEMSKHFKLGARFGVWVQELAKDSPAEIAGIEAGDNDERETFNGRSYLTGGDVIVRVEGRRVRNEHELARVLLDFSPGQQVEVVTFRDGEQKRFQVKLQERPEIGED